MTRIPHSTFVVAENPLLVFSVSKLPACMIKCSLVPVRTNIWDTGLLNCAGDINKNPYLRSNWEVSLNLIYVVIVLISRPRWTSG
jgi:hypothetical protein